jgi:hypothetical protein
MNEWLIVTNDQLTALNTINDAHSDQKCTAVQTTDSIWVTSADKIGNNYWADWQDFLQSLTPFQGIPTFPTPTDV